MQADRQTNKETDRSQYLICTPSGGKVIIQSLMLSLGAYQTLAQNSNYHYGLL